MKKIGIAVLALAIFSAASAQDATVKDLKDAASKDVKSMADTLNGWTKAGTFALNLNQGSLSNWAAGGEQNTLGINGILNYGVNYRNGKNTWDTYFDLALGFQNATSFNRFRKIDDRIDITSKYGRQINTSKWYATILGNFNTQMLKGYDYKTNSKISNLLTPGKFLLALGFDYKPNDNFSFFISPATSRWIFKSDADFKNLDAFGVPAGKSIYNEIGAYASMKYTKALAPWASYTGRIDLFSNYKRNPGNVDLFITNLLAMKFNKWLGATISVDMIYDDDIVKKLQLKEILGIGLTTSL